MIVPCQLSSVIPACQESKRDMIPDVAGMTILRHNKVDMTLCFLGTFSVNFEIPDYWGIGKSVSRGFGTVVRHRA